ncbi:MAG: glycosyltransferase family 9 protein [Prevotella sp.]|nr:glycosyltransferase family 9 protein [Prevotella sp.]MBQ6210711.1 glycosyltransferase family 9 protein [Prevotella sp.]
MKTEHILIIRFSALGDVAMIVPVVYSLAHQYPHLRITVLSRPFARPLFDNLAPNVGFMEADVKSEYRGVKGLNALYRRLMAKNFTAIADLHDIIRSKYLRLRFNLGRHKVAHVNKHHGEKRRLTAQNGKQLHQLPTVFQNYADVFAELGYPVDLQFTSIFSREGGSLFLLPQEIGERKSFQQWIGIAPFAAHPNKVYPVEKMEEVIRSIIKLHPSCRIFLFGGGGKEKETLDGWQQKYEPCVNASALLRSLEKELILISHLDVLVSMDSANMHLASLVNTPVVSVWGATHPYAGFLGWNQDPANIVQADLSCRPCSVYGRKACVRGDLACMGQIQPIYIINKVEEILSKR